MLVLCRCSYVPETKFCVISIINGNPTEFFIEMENEVEIGKM